MISNNIPQGYKDSPLGVIPQEWEVKRLGEVCLKIQDGNYGADYPKEYEFLVSGIPFITSKALGGEGVLNVDKVNYISADKHAKLRKAQLELNDILFTNRGANVGVTCMVDARLHGGNIGPQVTLLRVHKSLVNCSYVFQYSKGYSFLCQVHSQDSGSAMNFFGIGDTAKFKIAFPPLPEQQRIAEVLGTWDVAIEKQGALVDKLTERKRALMQQLLTAKKRLPNFSEPWETVRLGEVAEIYQPQTISSNELTDKGYQVYGANGQIGFYSRYNHELPQVVITCRGSSCGTVNITPSKCWITGNAMVVNVDNKENIDKDYFYYLMSNSSFKALISGSGQPQIVRTPLVNYSVYMPTLKEQTAIAQILTTADREIEEAKAKLESLRSQKRGLMQQLLSGKKRIKI